MNQNENENVINRKSRKRKRYDEMDNDKKQLTLNNYFQTLNNDNFEQKNKKNENI